MEEKNKKTDGSPTADELVERMDAMDSNESISRTKWKRNKPANKNDENSERDLIKIKDAKKVGFVSLTGKYWLRKWHVSIWIVIFALFSSASIAMGPLIIRQMTWAISLQNAIDLNQIKNIAYLNSHVPFETLGRLHWTQYMGIQFGLFGVIIIAQFSSTLIGGYLGKKIEIDLRNATIEKLILQDMSFYSDKKIGDMLTKVVSDTQIIGDQSQSIPVAFVSAMFTTIGSVTMMLVMDWKIALVAVAIFVIIFGFMGLSFGSLRKRMFKARETITRINGTVINRINTVQLIKTSGTEEQEKGLFKNLHVEYEDNYRKMVTVQSVIIMFLIVGVSAIQAILVACMAGIYHSPGDNLKLMGLIPSFVLAAGIMTGPIMQVIRVFAGITQASTSAERIAEILATTPRIDAHVFEGQGIYIDEIKGDIVFDKITFAYPEKPDKVIIPNFDMRFEEGKTYAFVGETGSGKSTASRLLLRFYDPTVGRVLINGDIDLRDVHMPSYLEKVGYVEQEPQILLGTVADNVRYGTEGKTDEEVMEACKKAELHKIIMSWPEGYNTILGERGFILSGGQKQRLVIARMFLKDPQLLILDEATSALDNIVEKEIQEKLNELMKGRTTVSIAHRLSTIKNADEIIVLAPGKGVIQKGTFKELKSQPGHFKELFEAGAMK